MRTYEAHILFGNIFWFSEEKIKVDASSLEDAITKARVLTLQRVTGCWGRIDKNLDICDCHLYERDQILHKCSLDLNTMNWIEGRSFLSDVDYFLKSLDINPNP